MHANGSLGSVLVDSAIAGASAVVGLMAGTAIGVVRADPVGYLYAVLVAFAVSFFASLQAARGRRLSPLPPPS